jgi:hypothetical protein
LGGAENIHGGSDVLTFQERFMEWGSFCSGTVSEERPINCTEKVISYILYEMLDKICSLFYDIISNSNYIASKYGISE